MKSFALKDTKTLADICGGNDYNLRILEKLIGGTVLCRGNEIFFQSVDSARQELFIAIMEELLANVEHGLPASAELIIAIHAALSDGKQDGEYRALHSASFEVPHGFHKIFPRSLMQGKYLAGMEKNSLTFAIGPAGTGKTYLAIAFALKQILTKQKRKLILTRPVVEAGESLGFLPGALEQKISPYLRPLYDAMEAIIPFEIIRRLEDSRTIEIAPLAYMRGRSLTNCLVILDEAQNTSKEQMKMFLTRLGEGTKAIVLGDTTQIDLPRQFESGLRHALTLLEGLEDIFICPLTTKDVVRSELAKRIITAYEGLKA